MPKRLALILCCSLAVAACGSSSRSNTQTVNTAKVYSQALAFSKCMRSHGVPKFPDPSTHGGGVRIQLSSGLNPQSPAFKAAQSACRKLMPGPVSASGHASAQAKEQMLKVSKCMRSHGISGFPDPTTHPPSSPAGYSAIIGRNGVAIAVPSSIDTRSPAFKKAAAACNFGGG